MRGRRRWVGAVWRWANLDAEDARRFSGFGRDKGEDLEGGGREPPA